MSNNNQGTITKGEWIRGGISALFLVFLAGACMSGGETTSTASSSSSKTCTKEAWICAAEKHEISMRWGCEDSIKSGLKDPRSYQAHDVRYYPSMSQESGALVMVKINYGARNGFGGMTRGNAVCHADQNGNIISAKYLS